MIEIIIILVLLVTIVNYLSEYAFNKAFNKHKRTEKEAYEYLKLKNVLDLDLYKEVPREEITIKSIDNLNLKGYLLEKYKDSNKYIILVHGYSANNHIDMSYARMFINEGFNVLVIDQRAHGNSEGKYPSYGYYEHQDLSKWVDFLCDRNKRELFIGLHGQSMGGATVLLCGSKDKRIKFIIEDCGFSSGKEIIKHQIKSVKWVPFNTVYYMLNSKIKRRIKFNLNDVRPLDSIKDLNTPILFIHGDKDTCVPCSMAYKMYKERNNSNDRIFIVNGAEHMWAYSMKKREYESICHEFIENVLKTTENR